MWNVVVIKRMIRVIVMEEIEAKVERRKSTKLRNTKIRSMKIKFIYKG